MGGGSSGSMGGASNENSSGSSGLSRKMSGRRIRDFVRGLTSSGDKEKDDVETVTFEGERIEAIDAQSANGLKRVLYTANVGDARAVLRFVYH